MLKIRAVRMLMILVFSIAAVGMAQAGTVTTIDGNVTVTDVVTSIGGGLFQYNYTVGDGTIAFGAQGLAVLDIAVTPGVPISGLSAPGGAFAFTSIVDTVGSGSSEKEFVSFIENNGSFTSAPESGFIFDSPVGPAPTTFGVTLADGTAGTGSGLTGPVVPEPGSLMLCALGGAILLFWRKRFLSSRHS